eukprot:1736701-Pyramimonas_sp.AAC.1
MSCSVAATCRVMSPAHLSSEWCTGAASKDFSNTSSGSIVASCERNMATEQPGSTPRCTWTA